MSTQPTDAMIDRLAYLAASIRQGEGPSVRCEGPGDYEVSVARQWVNRVLRAQAMHSARTPPPCAGDDVERIALALLTERYSERAAKYQQQFDTKAWRDELRVARVAIAALGTTPSIVGQEKLDG